MSGEVAKSSWLNERAGKNKSSSKKCSSGIGAIIFFLVVALVLYRGWQTRELEYVTAESGVGYVLGIVGGVMMLMLLLYPLRKRISALRILGSIKHWFRVHMILGVLGPTMILYHCNFQLGAINSNVALLCMSIVAASGLLGRYFYSRIHYGLYGSQATVRELQQDSNWKLNQLVQELHYIPWLQEKLKSYERSAVKAGQGWLSFITIPWLALTTHFSYFRVFGECRTAISREISDRNLRTLQIKKTRVSMRTYFRAVRRMAEFGFYAKLFAAWHVLHLPLFFMMLVTGIIHVVAVHMY